MSYSKVGKIIDDPQPTSFKPLLLKGAIGAPWAHEAQVGGRYAETMIYFLVSCHAAFFASDATTTLSN